MPLDTRQDRMSAMLLGVPWRGALVDATEVGSNAGNRAAGAFMYSGFGAAAVTSGTRHMRQVRAAIRRGRTCPPKRRRKWVPRLEWWL